MRNRFVDAFDVILLDQGKTFMFENDRFGPGVDYYPAYVHTGGSKLSRRQVQSIMDRLVERLFQIWEDLQQCNSFPRVGDVLKEMRENGPEGSKLNDAEIQRIDMMVSLHEIGTISSRHAASLKALAARYRLGIISNVWGPKEPFEDNLKRAGVFPCFEHIVWSSDYGCVKPDPRLFRLALQHFGVDPARVLFVGDSPQRDVHPARKLGCSAVWITNNESGREGGDTDYPLDLLPPDLIISDLSELVDA
ncbi:MAG TPA: HAD family hydrolase [Candidatus Methylacidiphilales bacterium]|nr:HAD family hydrolase [Candidatus Methylacidiphilales bacterium]